jgi:hypothetical protein
MIALIEIVLTIVAYRKGWKLKALLPLASSLVAAFLMGIALGAGGGSVQRAMPAFFMVDVVCLGVLIGLCVRAPRNSSAAFRDRREANEGPLGNANYGSVGGN